MEYERIHKVQMGVLSPTKLRMKLLAARKKSISKGGSSTSQTSPSKTEELEYANSLLDDKPNEGSKKFHGVLKTNNVTKLNANKAGLTIKDVGRLNHGNQNESTEKNGISQQSSSIGFSPQLHTLYNMNMIHPVRTLDEVRKFQSSGNDNINSNTFEFHRAERTAQHLSYVPFTKSVPSKWNDAEKWIVNKRKVNPSILKKSLQHNQVTHQLNFTWQRASPELMTANDRPSVSEVSDMNGNVASYSTSDNVVDKFSFIPQTSNNSFVESANFSVLDGESESLTTSRNELNNQRTLETETYFSQPAVTMEQSVSMRDVGTEMTPVPTPLGSITPTRSPLSLSPPTPRGVSATPIIDTEVGNEPDSRVKRDKEELSQKDLKLKTRREIAALGIQLGKTKIASWATKEEAELACPSPKPVSVHDVNMEYVARAVAWQEVENSRHLARYKHDEVKIQAWENSEKAKLEAKMKSIEAKAEEMKTRALEKMAEKLAVTKQQVEEKRAAAEARMNKEAAKVAHKAEQIRRTGQLPSTNYLCCSGLF